jgi:CDGSH-type Zn-finger protein
MFTNDVDLFTTTGAVDNPYSYPAFKLESTNVDTKVPADANITPSLTGPYIVSGPVTLTDVDGRKIAHSDQMALCRCGHSNNKPFCDGTHLTILRWHVEELAGDRGRQRRATRRRGASRSKRLALRAPEASRGDTGSGL